MKRGVVAIVPARGGSKGIPRKNIKTIAGKPLIAWTIEAALKSRYIERLIVSTDDDEIAEIARLWGAEVPFMRPEEFAKDTSSGMEPVFHVLSEVPGIEYVVLLQPTSPLRLTEDIDGAIAKCLDSKVSSCVSVCEAGSHPYLCYSMPKREVLLPAIEGIDKNMRRQDMPPYFELNGAVYVASKAHLTQNKSFLGDETVGFTMPIERSMDIDTLFDFEMAEFLLKKKLGSKI